MKHYLIRHIKDGKEIASKMVTGYAEAVHNMREWYCRDMWAEDFECHRKFEKTSFRVAGRECKYCGKMVKLKYVEKC